MADFASVDMTGKLRAERSSQVLADCTVHRHTQSVCQMTGRGHPNALIVGKVPEGLEIGRALTGAVRGRSPQYDVRHCGGKLH